MGGSARARHEERWTSTKKQRVSSTSFRVKRAVIEFWSVFFSLNNPWNAYRGRDIHCWMPPAQIPAGVIHAPGSHLGWFNDESHEQLRVHSRAFGTRLIRRSVQYVCCSPMFPSVLSLGSTNSAPSRPGLFVGFNAIMKRSDFSCPCFIGFDSSPSRCGPLHDF